LGDKFLNAAFQRVKKKGTGDFARCSKRKGDTNKGGEINNGQEGKHNRVPGTSSEVRVNRHHQVMRKNISRQREGRKDTPRVRLRRHPTIFMEGKNVAPKVAGSKRKR